MVKVGAALLVMGAVVVRQALNPLEPLWEKLATFGVLGVIAAILMIFIWVKDRREAKERAVREAQDRKDRETRENREIETRKDESSAKRELAKAIWESNGKMVHAIEQNTAATQRLASETEKLGSNLVRFVIRRGEGEA